MHASSFVVILESTIRNMWHNHNLAASLFDGYEVHLLPVAADCWLAVGDR